MALRISSSFVLLISLLYMPFWVSVILALVMILYFSFFGESTILFLISDLLFGVKEAMFLNEVFISFVVSIVVLTIVEIVKNKLRIKKLN